MSHPNDENHPDATADYVRAALRDAAQTHRPDRRAMAHRVASGRATARSKGRRGMYPIAAAFAVAVIVVFSVVAVRSTGDNGTHRGANPPVAAPLPSAAPSSPARTTGASSAPPSRSATTAAPNGFVTVKGGLDANSVATWSQNNVTVTNTKALAALRVTITVDLTPGAADAGRYTNVPNADVTMTVTRGASALTYAYVLKQGTNLAPGSYIFAAQFQHRSGRMMDNDSYTVAAGTRTAHAELSGAFI
jgi:hypothetical protein